MIFEVNLFTGGFSIRSYLDSVSSLKIHLVVEECMILVLHIYSELLLVSISRFGYPVYVHIVQEQVLVNHELFCHDTFSAYPVYVLIVHGYSQSWEILGLELSQLCLIS